MKKQIIIFVVFSLLLFNAGNLRCESPPAGLSKARPQSEMANKTLGLAGRDQDVQEEKNERFKVLEWLIRQNLMRQYQQMEAKGDPEDSLD